MVDFALTEEQEELRRLAREFAQKDIAPVAMHYDKTGEFPWEVYRKAYDVGLMNPSVPTAYAGGGLGARAGVRRARSIRDHANARSGSAGVRVAGRGEVPADGGAEVHHDGGRGRK